MDKRGPAACFRVIAIREGPPQAALFHFKTTIKANPMSNRRATVTQADIARAIRAAKKEGLTVARLVVRIDGVAVETSENDQPGATMTIASESEVVL